MDKLDMSLDDIIKKDKIKVGGRGRGRGGRGTRGMSRARGFRQSSAGGRGRGNWSTGTEGVRGGRVQQRRGNRGASSSFTRSQQVPDVWQHDKFEGAAPVRRLSGGSTGNTGKLLVSNLDFGVNDSDVRELFAEFGQLKKASVHYDRSGRSIGTAEIIFELRTDAVKALKQYNNVPLDGRAMKIQLVGAEASSAPVTSRLSRGTNNRSPRGGFRGNTRGTSRGRGGRGGGRGGSRKPVSKEDLDAQLDAYNSKMDTD